MSKFYVYGLFDPKKDFPFYIGKGKEDRMYKHFMESRKGRNLHKDNKIEKVKREGRKPYARKLYGNLTEDEAYMREWCLINLYYDKLTNIDRTYGNGIKSGKQHPWYGKEHTEEWKDKMSEMMKGKNNPSYGGTSKSHSEAVSKALTGKSLPEETKQKISQKMKGRTLSESHKEKLSESKKGENSYNSKITKEEAAEVKWLAKNTNKTQKEIGSEYGISFQSVSAIKNDRSWEHVEASPVE